MLIHKLLYISDDNNICLHTMVDKVINIINILHKL